MLKGKELILATKQFAVENRFKSWFYSLSTLFLLIITQYFSGITQPILGKLFFSVLCSLMISRMFVIYHDHQHHAILNKSFPAKIIFTLFGIYSLAPPSIWKRSHDYHHAHNSKLFSASIGSYPIMTRQKFLSISKSEQKAYLAVRHPLTVLFAYFTMFIYGMCIQSFLSSKSRHWDSLLSLIFHFSIAVFLFYSFGWATWFFAWFLPFFIAFALGGYLFYAQHNFPGVVFKENADWTYEGASLNSSSYMTMSKFGHWVTANIGYHHIHHLNSRIPFYRLPEVMSKMPELQNATRTSLRIKDIIACFKLKLWDPDQNRMIGLHEL